MGITSELVKKLEQNQSVKKPESIKCMVLDSQQSSRTRGAAADFYTDVSATITVALTATLNNNGCSS
jgi:hypothetical protein